MVRLLLIVLLLFLLVGCQEERKPLFVPALGAEIDRVEARLAVLTTADVDEDNCQHALRTAKQMGGVIYVDQMGHCTFVRPLPRRRR